MRPFSRQDKCTFSIFWTEVNQKSNHVLFFVNNNLPSVGIFQNYFLFFFMSLKVVCCRNSMDEVRRMLEQKHKVNCSYVQCTLAVHQLYTSCTLAVHQLYTSCTLAVHQLYSSCTLAVHQLYTSCTLDVHQMYTRCTLDVHYCTLAVHQLYTSCTPAVHQLCLYEIIHYFFM